MSKLISKFETKSNRVKGLSFHPHRPWLLAALHTGVIQLWDYRVGTLTDAWDEHDGPVRGVAFHNSQPLFVSGGDDYKIKVWNYKQRRCLFTLMGHLDYIRTVQFHNESPWILSASDDQTIRVWNWQSRSCISVLTGHNHYVMCAQFHPKEDMVVSASLDQTVRVWDISGLRKKSMYNPPSQQDELRLGQSDLFGNSDACLKFAPLEGHDRGVNWVAFHPTLPLIVSGADDRQVKLWRMNESKAWEVDTLRGHYNNVSCVLFHPQQELILSNSEDKTIRVWDMAKRSTMATFRREHDRFWILTAHPTQNMFAAGHDSGLIVFKLERERPAYVSYAGKRTNVLFYIKDRYLRTFDYTSGRDVPTMSVRKASASWKPHSLSYNPAEKAVLASSETADGGSYELYFLPNGGDKGSEKPSKRGVGRCAVFVARNRFAVLDKSGQILIKTLANESSKKLAPSVAVDRLFPATTGRLLLRADDKVILFDVQQRKSVAEITAPPIRYVEWSGTGKNALVALMGKEVLILANRELEQMCTVHETIKIKSGCWDNNGVFIYTTLNHIKYCLPNGDSGIIRTLDIPIYLTSVLGNKVHCLDRQGKCRVISIDCTEYVFKLALLQQKWPLVLKMVMEANLIGNSIIRYLQDKGYPEVALHFVKDERTRFNLAIECGKIDEALKSAKVLDDAECWNQLGAEALRQGNQGVVEFAYQRNKNFEKLSFLYLITGNVEKLRRMLKIAEMRDDVQGRFHNALYLGDFDEMVSVLLHVKQLSLAYIMAHTHGLHERLAAIEEAAAAAGRTLPDVSALAASAAAARLHPPPVLNQLVDDDANWPQLVMQPSIIDTISQSSISEASVANVLAAAAEAEDEDDEDGGWADGDIAIPGHPDDGASDLLDGAAGDDGEAGWDVDLPTLDVGDLPTGAAAGSTGAGGSYYVAPTPGPSPATLWVQASRLAADHACAGSFDTAMRLLNQQIGAVSFACLKPFMMSLYTAATLRLPTMPSSIGLSVPLTRSAASVAPRERLPRLSVTMDTLIERLKAAYAATTGGKFTEAQTHFSHILHGIPFVVLETRQQVAEAKALLALCREYLIGITVELQRRETKDAVRQCELAAYFTKCDLQAKHLALSVRSAMKCAFDIKNYVLAATFGRRLLELQPTGASAAKTRKLVQFCDGNPTDAHPEVRYDDRNPFSVCCVSFTPIYKGNALERCPYCEASYLPQYAGQLCSICKLSEVGKDVQGLQLVPMRS